jgi:hypothetical protein
MRPDRRRIAAAMLDLQARRVALVSFMLRRNRLSAPQRLLLTPWLLVLYARLLVSVSTAGRTAAAEGGQALRPSDGQ